MSSGENDMEERKVLSGDEEVVSDQTKTKTKKKKP